MKRSIAFLFSVALCAGQKLGPEQQQFCKGIEEIQCGYLTRQNDGHTPASCASVIPGEKPVPTTGNPIQDARRPAQPPAPPPGPFFVDKLAAALGRNAGKFENWPGRVWFFVSNGRVGIKFFPTCGFTQPEPDPARGDLAGSALFFETQWWKWHKEVQTSPPLNSALADTLSHLKQGATVTASGKLIWITNGKRDYIAVGGENVDATAYYVPSPRPGAFFAMSPGFVAEFTSIQPAK